MKQAALLAAAALAAGSAFLLSRYEARRSEDAFASKRIFPHLAEQLPEAREIRITRGKGLGGAETITLIKAQKDSPFLVSERDGFPANQKRARHLILGLSRLKAHEPRSEREEDHADLGLVPPEKLGTALRIALKDMKGKTIANLLVGKRPFERASVLGENAIFVRKADDPQSWLARGSLPLRVQLRDWLALPSPAMALENIARMALFSAAESPPRAFFRESAEKPFSPQSEEAEIAARLISRLRFQDVRPRQKTDAPLWRVQYESFSGTRRTISLILAERRLWAAFREQNPKSNSSPSSDDLWRDWLFAIPADQTAPLLNLFRSRAGSAPARGARPKPKPRPPNLF